MKHKRGHKQLAKVAQWVNWVVAIAICIYAVLFFIVASQASGAFSGSTEIIVGALLQYAAYGAVTYIVGQVFVQTLLHFHRMEIIALDGPEAFEPEEAEETEPAPVDET